jgi:hypothetical protein
MLRGKPSPGKPHHACLPHPAAEARLAYLGHLLMENRNGLIVDAYMRATSSPPVPATVSAPPVSFCRGPIDQTVYVAGGSI